MNDADDLLKGLERLPRRVWVYERDVRGQIVRARSLGGWVLSVACDEQIRWREIRDRVSLLARTEYDEFGNETEIRDAEGMVSATQYDDLHRPMQVTQGSSGVTRYQWNGVGRMTERVRPGDQRDTWQYDQYGQRVT